jgi:hypothetical protein
MTKQTSYISIVSAVNFIFSLFIFTSVVLLEYQHRLYSELSVFLMLFTSILLLTLSLVKNVAVLWVILLSILYFFSRYIVIYFFPELMDYDSYVNFSKKDIEGALWHYSLSILGLLFAYVFSLLRLKPRPIFRKISLSYDYINVFGIVVNFNFLVKLFLYMGISLVIFRMLLIFYSSIGLTGSFFTADITYLIRIAGLSSILLYPVFFLYVYFSIKERGIWNKSYNIARFAMVVQILNLIIMSSRALILNLILNVLLAFLILNVKFKFKHFIMAFAMLLFAVFIFYPVVTNLRSALLTGDYMHIFEGGRIYQDLIVKISGRLGVAYESWILWYSKFYELMPIYDSFFFVDDIFRLINTFSVGDIFSVSDRVPVDKLQMVIGRGFSPSLVNDLGGGGESPGPLSMVWFYLAEYGFFYWFFLYLILIKISSSTAHPFWKFIFIGTLSTGPTENIIMPVSLFTFLVILLFLSIIIKIYNNRHQFF